MSKKITLSKYEFNGLLALVILFAFGLSIASGHIIELEKDYETQLVFLANKFCKEIELVSVCAEGYPCENNVYTFTNGIYFNGYVECFNWDQDENYPTPTYHWEGNRFMRVR